MGMHHIDWACTLKPVLHKRRCRGEKLVHRNGEQPHTAAKTWGNQK